MFNFLNTSAIGALIGTGHLHAWVWRQFGVWEGELDNIGTVIGPWLGKTDDPDTGLPLGYALWYFNASFGGRQISTASYNIQCINLQYTMYQFKSSFLFQDTQSISFSDTWCICYFYLLYNNCHLLLIEIEYNCQNV